MNQEQEQTKQISKVRICKEMSLQFQKSVFEIIEEFDFNNDHEANEKIKQLDEYATMMAERGLKDILLKKQLLEHDISRKKEQAFTPK